MAKKMKIPKHIAGVKVPRALRKSQVLRMLLANQTGRQVLGEALVAGATAAAAILAGRNREEIGDAAEGAGKRVRKTGKLAVHAVTVAAGAMTDVIAEAALAALAGPDRHHRRDRGKPVTH